MLQKERKSNIITQFRLNEDDTGSVEVQVALLTERIEQLMEHLKAHSHDHHSRRALLKLIGHRRRLLIYLNKTAPERYYSLTARLGLRK
jgi:small subunit ribosomal protein S15